MWKTALATADELKSDFEEKQISPLLRAPKTRTMSVGIPVKLIHEATGHVVTIELKTGCVYRGTLLEAEDSLNCQLRNVNATARDGSVTEIEQIYIRGSHVRLVIVPDMLRNAPMFKKIGAAAKGHSGVAKAKGTVARMAGKHIPFSCSLT